MDHSPQANMSWKRYGFQLLLFLAFLQNAITVEALVSNKTALRIAWRINREGPYLGVIMALREEQDPLLSAAIFEPHRVHPWLDLAGRRFFFGTVYGQRVTVVQSGEAMLNAGVATQLLLDFFDISGVVHYGICGCTNSSLNIGDVSIPEHVAHTGNWEWQRFGVGSNGSEAPGQNHLGNLHFGDFNVPKGEETNLLSNALLKPEDVYSVASEPSIAQSRFWVAADQEYFVIASTLEGLELESCINKTNCLSVQPRVVVGLRASSASVFLDNAAYRDFLSSSYNVSSVDMESAAVGLVCLSNNVPFIVIRAVSDMAGGSEHPNEAHIYGQLAVVNAVKVVVEFIKQVQSGKHLQAAAS